MRTARAIATSPAPVLRNDSWEMATGSLVDSVPATADDRWRTLRGGLLSVAATAALAVLVLPAGASARSGIDVGSLRGKILFTRAGHRYGDETVFTATGR